MDDLNDEQFIDSLSLTNRIIYIRRKTTNLLRAWIIVQERILKFDNVRAAVQNGGYEPWETSHPVLFGLELLICLKTKMKNGP